MIDRRPALVVRCAGVNDIKQAVDFARAHGLLTSVKEGGIILPAVPYATGTAD